MPTIKALLALVAALTLGACVSPRRYYASTQPVPISNGPLQIQNAPQQQVAVGTAAPAGSSTVLRGTALEQLGQLDGILARLGYQRRGAAVHGTYSAQGLTAFALDVAPMACYAVIALEETGVDIDLEVLDPQWRSIASDFRRDAHPWVTFCPGVAGRAVSRIHMRTPIRGYYYAAYVGPWTTPPSLAQYFGDGAAQPAVAATLDPSTTQRISALDTRVAQEGFRRVQEPQGFAMSNAEARQSSLQLQQGACYGFAAFAGPGATDADLFLTDGSGATLASDSQTSADAFVRYCPQTTGNYTVRLLLSGGNGPVFGTAYVQQTGQSATTAPATIVQTSASTVSAGLDENYRFLDADMRARGYVTNGDSSSETLQEMASRDFELSLEGGKCYAVLAVGDNGVRNLDLQLLKGTRVLDEDVEPNARPIVRVCATDSGNFTVKVRATSGQGRFLYQAYKWPRGTRGPFGLRGLIYVRLAEVTSLLSVEGFAPDSDFAPELGEVTTERSHHLTLRGGAGGAQQCYAVLAVGGDGVRDLDAVLSDHGTRLAEDGTDNAFPSVRYCVTDDREVDLTVRAARGSGQYFYQVFRQGEE